MSERVPKTADSFEGVELLPEEELREVKKMSPQEAMIELFLEGVQFENIGRWVDEHSSSTSQQELGAAIDTLLLLELKFRHGEGFQIALDGMRGRAHTIIMEESLGKFLVGMRIGMMRLASTAAIHFGYVLEEQDLDDFFGIDT